MQPFQKKKKKREGNETIDRLTMEDRHESVRPKAPDFL